MVLKRFLFLITVTGTFPFERAEEAFKKAGQRGSLKVLLDFR
jgi:hypothetical protein